MEEERGRAGASLDVRDAAEAGFGEFTARLELGWIHGQTSLAIDWITSRSCHEAAAGARVDYLRGNFREYLHLRIWRDRRLDDTRSLDDHRKEPFMATLVILEVKVKPEAVQGMKETLKAALPDTRKFAGCQGVTFYSKQDEPTTIVAIEKWDTKAAYEKYLAWRTETGFMEKFGAALAAPPSIRYFDAVDA
jgi:quinol monooxygenase YgiN